MRRFSLIAVALLLPSCGSRDDGSLSPALHDDRAPAAAASNEASAAPTRPGAPAVAAASGWGLQSSGEGAALVLRSGELRLFCPVGEKRLLVNVPGFRAIGSEERLSFGVGGHAVALVADTRGDKERGGVTGTGSVPADLALLVAGPISAAYGAQKSGPHSAPPKDLARSFVAACHERRDRAQPEKSAAASVGACMTQGEQRLQVAPLRAVGTEPFWSARIEGRCITYSHPEDPKGARVWTRYAAGPSGGGTWLGALGGRKFELKARRSPGCSDGMSDKSYPFAVDLSVHGEQRRGCAEPL